MWLTDMIRKLLKGEPKVEKETWLVVGLGNPGSKYEHTRHNVGFDVTDALCRKLNLTLNREKFEGRYAETDIAGKRVVICQPLTFMNASGACVQELVSWYKVPLERLLIIYDDIDLPAAKLRIRKSGSAGTHNGMRSIVASLPGQEFPRMRVGVGSKPQGWDLADWVLSHYQTQAERDAMNAAFEKAADAVDCWLREGIDPMMQKFNGK